MLQTHAKSGVLYTCFYHIHYDILSLLVEEPSFPTVEPVDPSSLTLEEASTDSYHGPPPPVQPQPSPPKVAAKAPPPDGPQDRKAKEFIDQAEKKLKSSQSFFGGLFG